MVSHAGREGRLQVLEGGSRAALGWRASGAPGQGHTGLQDSRVGVWSLWKEGDEMQRSAKAGVLLAVLRRCDAAWKKQQPGGTRAIRQLVPRFRRALAASLPRPLPSWCHSGDSPSASQPPLGRLPSAGSTFSQETSLQAWLGLSGLSRIPCWSSAAIRRNSGQSPPASRSGRSILQERASYTAACYKL